MLISIQLLICCLQFLLLKQQATNNGYMNTCPCSLTHSRLHYRLAINQARHWESGKEATLCHSNPQKREESCLTGTLVLQEVVTYMFRVEAFGTWIKIEPSKQSPFWGLTKVTSELLKPMDQEHMAAIWSLILWKSSAQEPQKGAMKRFSTPCRSKTLISVTNAWIWGM